MKLLKDGIDSVGNIGLNDTIYFTVNDTTAPTITVLSPLNTTYSSTTIWFNASASETVDTWMIDYNGTNVTLDNINQSFVLTEGAHNVTFYANDTKGNLGVSETVNFTITLPVEEEEEESSGSTKGKQSGGVPSNERSWNIIKPGEWAELNIRDSDLMKIEFVSNIYLRSVNMKITNLDSFPEDVIRYHKQYYGLFKIDTKNVVITDGKISFKISKQWINDLKLTREEIALFRYVGNNWIKLDTSYLNQDEDYFYYSADTPGFSYFMIAENGVVNPTIETIEEPVLEEKPSEEEVTNYVVLALVFVVTLLTSILTLAVMRRKVKKQFERGKYLN